MAVSQLCVSLGVFLMLCMVQGQFEIKDIALPGCNRADIRANIYSRAHPHFAQVYLQCDIGLFRSVQNCPDPLLYDVTLRQCNWPAVAVVEIWPCNVNMMGKKYPATCNNKFYECNGSGFDAKECDPGQYFNIRDGVCSTNQFRDTPMCVRLGTNQGDPRKNCSLVPEPSDRCSYRTMSNGILSEQALKCAEGTEFSEGNCTCVHSQACFRSSNSSRNKIPDVQCKASFKVDFIRVFNNVPQVVSEKLGSGDETIPSFIESSGVEFSGGMATLFTSANTAAEDLPYLYIPVYSNNQLGMNIVISIIFRASQQSSNFELLSNNIADRCKPTIELKGQFTGSSYTLSLSVLGANMDSLSGNGTTSATITNTINAGSGEFIEARIIFDGHAALLLKSKGQNGDNNGQVITGTPSGFLGNRLAFNACGLRIANGLNGNVKRFVVRESCSDAQIARAMP